MLCLDIHLCGVLFQTLKKRLFFLTQNSAVDAHTRWPQKNPSPTEKSFSRLGENLMNATN